MSGTATSELIEIFSAIQGEGPIVGRRQIFVRFGRCDVKCDYCDTPLCHVELPECRIETGPATREFERHRNPVPWPLIAEFIRRLDTRRGLHHSISWTGGEPLLHAPAIAAIGPEFRDRGLILYLETNGHLVDELRVALPGVDLVGMDIKIPSTTGFPARHAENRAFLRLALESGKGAFVKVVVGDATTDDELLAALDAVADVEPRTQVVLQPVTPFAGRGVPPSAARLLALDALARTRLPDVLVIPQTHKMIGQL